MSNPLSSHSFYPDKKINIIIVEDERLIAEDIRFRLESMDYGVAGVCSSGEDAVEQIRKSQPDIVLMDIMLKGRMDGIETSEIIRRDYDLPVVYLTSHADPETLARVKLSQPYGYVMKPFIDKELKGVIETALYRSQIERLLRIREAWLSSTLESIQDGVATTDNEGTISFINDVAVQLLQHPEGSPVGRALSDVFLLFHKEDILPVDKALEKALNGDIAPFPEDLLLKNGKDRYVPIEASIAPIQDYKSIIGAVLVFRDVSQRKRIEAALEDERRMLAKRVKDRTEELSIANAELARAVRLKDEFLANMSHELRTPLNAVLGMSEALQDEVYGSLNERQKKSLKIIEESGRHLLSLINDILDVSKIEAGKFEFQTGPVSASSAAEASLAMIKQSAQKKNITIDLNIDKDIPPFIADEKRLKQILVNLLTNAVKFTPENGKIGLGIKLDLNNDSLHFDVWDSGIGIREENMARLFKPFVQLDSKLSREHSGTGLGLALVRRLADMHGGSVEIKSKAGEGSQFIVSIPWRPAEVPMDKIPEASSHAQPDLFFRHGCNLLLVEDNEENIATIGNYLQAQGFSVSIARNGFEAINSVKAKKPDLILMDIQMPKMDGLETIKRLRKKVDADEIPIIALTALAMPGDREKCLEAGADEYLTKPVGLKILAAGIRKHLIKKRKP
jgi:PAS domain S-box-containing protein